MRNPCVLPLIASLAILSSINVNAQPVNNQVKDVVMPPPNVASLGKYGDIPVSYFTGVPDITIPIANLQEGPLYMPVSLSYHASGIKVAEPASWVGLGWNLNAGGMISRTIQGVADDAGGIGYFVNPPTLSCSDESYLWSDGAAGTLDFEPDIFNYSFGGYSGKFYFDNNHICRFLPAADITLQHYSVANTFEGFILTTPDGTRWHFGKTDLPTTRTAYDYTQSTNEAFERKTTWHLLRVETYDLKFSINLYYSADEYGYRSPASCKNVITPAGCLGGADPGEFCSSDLSLDYYHHYIKSNIKGKHIQKITTSTNTIDFSANNDRQDLDVNNFAGSIKKSLDEIKFYTLDAQGNINNNYCSSYQFSYSYWQDPLNTGSESKRLKLTQVQRKSCDGFTTVEPPYIFTYEAGDLPYRLSKQVDHWGYFNGQTQNETKLVNISPTTLSGITYGSSNRNSSQAMMKRGVLKEITYPTGGKTIFDYEANRMLLSSGTTNERLSLKSCTTTISSCCGVKTNQSANISFTAAELNDTKYQIKLWRIPSPPPPGQNCSDASMVNAVAQAFNATNGNAVGNPVSLNLAVNQQYIETVLTNISPSLITSPVAGQLYYFRITTNDGYGELRIVSTTYSNQNQIVGGLRIKEIRNHDGISSSNDVVKRFEYTNQNDTLSSGKYLEYFPGNLRYGFIASQGVLVFTDEQIVPLGTLGHGMHIGYERVKEIVVGSPDPQGNGTTIYRHTWSVTSPSPFCGASGQYPIAPIPTNPLIGSPIEVNNGPVVESTTYETPSSTLSTGHMFKIAPPIGCQGFPNQQFIPALVIEYDIRQYSPVRPQSVLVTKDGVTTTTTYTYDPLNRYLAPKAVTYTNSDGQIQKTEYAYPVTLAFACLRTELLNRNIKTIPTSTRNYVGTTLVSADSTRWSNWSSGFPNATCNSTNTPYPWEFYRYEMTFDASGNALAGTWDRQGVMDERWTTNGLPKKFTMTCGADASCWKPEFYEWEVGGLIKKKTYNNDATAYKNFVTQYDYHAGTRLVSKITAVDGQFVDYTYDKLQRLSTVTSKSSNVKTFYKYTFALSATARNSVRDSTVFTDMTANGSAFKEKVIISYFDGLGRPVQTVDKKHSPNSKDVVVTTEYDKRGRVSKVYEPFESTLATGAFVATVPSPANTFFTLTEYHSDPLNRTWKVTPPSWYPTIYTYGTNLGTNVKLNHTTNTWYPANSLNQTTVEDPNGNRSFSFTDKKGRLILSRRRNNNGTQEANTYNLYDNKDRLTTVIPPDALITNSDLIFKYLYDAADNMIMKDVPDANPMNMRYNTRNLMTLMQDGNLLAAPNNWLATNYDIYGRPTSTGFVVNNSNPSPAGPFTFTTANKLTETTYDDVSGGQAIYKGKVKQGQVKIMDTANNSFITTNYTYDAHGRVSGTTANNFTGGSDNYAFTYDWADNRLTSSRTHKRLSTDATTTILETATYDHAGRTTLNKHKLNTAAEVTLSELNYNFKDELLEKNLGKVACASFGPGDCWLQSLDYAYSPQGWLTTINQATLGGTNVALAACPTNPTAPNPAVTGENDLFYLELKYDGQFTGMTGDTIQKNGNINQMMWRTRGRERQAYNFSYDYLDRLRSAVYADVNDAGTVTTNSRYNESLTYADARGNISNLKRVGGQLSGSCWNFAQIDNLTYSYTSGTNKISSITDAASATYKAKGFNPGGGTGSYTFDANGSLKTDPYKGIVNINYNHLNLPALVDMGGNKTLTNLYDADGVKLRMTVNNNGTITTRDYLDGIEYIGNTLESIYHTEGRVFKNGSVFRYEYAIADHLGNTRMTFTDKNGNGTIEITNSSTNEVLQENHYYPFGLNFDGPWMNDSGAADERYQFNGIERVGELGVNLDLAFFRANDPAIGRWWQVDPMTEIATDWSTYRFGFDNPLLYGDPLGLFETRREARQYRRNQDNEEVKDGKIKKNRDGTFSIRYGKNGNGSIAKNANGNIEYSAVATGTTLREHKDTNLEKMRDNNEFMVRVLYSTFDELNLTFQSLNPLDNQRTHLTGDLATQGEIEMAGVMTIGQLNPIGKGVATSKIAIPYGMHLMRRLSASQFSKLFKGTEVARMAPKTRGKINQLLNKKLIDTANKGVREGTVVLSGAGLVEDIKNN